MPRRRFLSPEFFKDEDLATLPYEARLLFQGLWCYADREGRLEDRPKYLKAEIFPYDRVDLEKLLSLLSNPAIPDRPSKVFIRRYAVEGRQYIEIIEFSKHQSPHKHEPDSSLPAIVCTTTDIVRLTTDIVGASTDTCPSVIDIRERTKDKGERTKDKRPLGEFLNVRLAEGEISKLETKFGKDDTLRYIENLSRYIEQHGKDKYKSHYATILAWAEKDGKKDTSQTHSPDDEMMYRFVEGGGVERLTVGQHNAEMKAKQEKAAGLL